MIQIRKKVFETNSSSTHSLVICTEDEFNKFKSGECVWEEIRGKIMDPNDPEAKWVKRYEDWGDYLETFCEYFTSPSGDKMVAFGEYGHD